MISFDSLLIFLIIIATDAATTSDTCFQIHSLEQPTFVMNSRLMMVGSDMSFQIQPWE